jgi:hypothetical protein
LWFSASRDVGCSANGDVVETKPTTHIFRFVECLLQARFVTFQLSEVKTMLWTIFVVLLVLWLLGMVSSYTLGGFIHILLVIALAVVLIRVIQGRRPV